MRLSVILLFTAASLAAQAPQPSANPLVETGRTAFQRDCAFCHGREAGGGESGPDLTRSKLVADDVNGNKIGPVVRNGVPDKGMPPFPVSDDQLKAVISFIQAMKVKAESQKGGRRGVDPADLQTGNAAAGKAYFNGAGGCAKCHNVTGDGDLAHIAAKYRGLQLEQRMLAPRGGRSTVKLTAGGQNIEGALAYLDEFTIALRDSNGKYRSYFVESVKFTVDSPVEAHAALFPKYTDDDIHNLMAYLQTLK